MKPLSLLPILTLLWLLPCTRAALAAEDSEVCAAEAGRQEKLQAIPERLLHSISLVESGRWDADRKANLAWPWTVMAEGEGRFLPSKQAAIAEVQKLRARGVRNIDVGCMQVNLLAHPDAFATLDEAFEPRNNVAYAARFLNELHDQTGNWPQAGAFYHSQTPELAAPYKAKLMSVWKGQPSLQLASLDVADEPRLPLGISFPITLPHRQTAEPVAAKADPLGRSDQEKLAAKRAADAYRQAKLDEYRQKHGLAAGG
jgi:hypothetical protein